MKMRSTKTMITIEKRFPDSLVQQHGNGSKHVIPSLVPAQQHEIKKGFSNVREMLKICGSLTTPHLTSPHLTSPHLPPSLPPSLPL